MPALPTLRRLGGVRGFGLMPVTARAARRNWRGRVEERCERKLCQGVGHQLVEVNTGEQSSGQDAKVSKCGGEAMSAPNSKVR
jgi:hypothetical protein